MKYVKTLGLAAIAAAALLAFVGVGTASAAVICSATETPCSAANKWPVGIKVGFETEESSIVKETSAPNGNGETLDTCKKSKITGELTKNSGTETATGPITTFDWEECTFTTTTIELGKFIVTGPLTGTSNGTVESDAEVRWTTSIPLFGSCVYGFPSGVSFGTLTEGKPATLDVTAVLTKRSGSSFTCPETALWSTKYTMIEPANTTAAVEPS